jgi:hypothetical protein
MDEAACSAPTASRRSRRSATDLDGIEQGLRAMEISASRSIQRRLFPILQWLDRVRPDFLRHGTLGLEGNFIVEVIRCPRLFVLPTFHCLAR